MNKFHVIPACSGAALRQSRMCFKRESTIPDPRLRHSGMTLLVFILICSLTFSNAQAFLDDQPEPQTQAASSQRDQSQVQASDSNEQTAKFAPDRIIVKMKEGKIPDKDLVYMDVSDDPRAQSGFIKKGTWEIKT